MIGAISARPARANLDTPQGHWRATGAAPPRDPILAVNQAQRSQLQAGPCKRTRLPIAWGCTWDQVGTARFWFVILGGVIVPLAVALWLLLAL